MTGHAVIRAEERYGVRLSWRQQSEIDRWIAEADPRTFPVRPDRDGGEVVAVLVSGRWMVALHHGNEVVTFFPDRLLGAIGYLLERHARTHGLDVDRGPLLTTKEIVDERRHRRRSKYRSRFAAPRKSRPWTGAGW